MSAESVYVLHYALEALVLAVAGWSDYRSREVDDRVWAAGAAVLAPLMVYEAYVGAVHVALYVVGAVVGLVVAGLFWLLGAMGEADVIELAFISLLTPPRGFSVCLSPALSVVVDSLPLVVLYALYNLAWNLRAGRDLFEGYDAGVGEKLYALLGMRYVSREEYERHRYMYAPGYVVEDGKRRIRVQLSVEEGGGGFEGGWALVYMPEVAVLAAGFAVYAVLALTRGGGCLLDLAVGRLLRAPWV